MIDSLKFQEDDGLLPAVVQDADTGEVLMVGFMNREAVDSTIRDGHVTFWSRSRRRLWKKGESSGNVLNVVDITPDCDRDTLLVRARPVGPTCHTGTRSCFSAAPEHSWSTLPTLESVIRDRRAVEPEGSYTAELFRAGTPRIAQKVGEEAAETIVAAMQDNRTLLTNETADLLYHVTVLLTDRGATWSDVMEELWRRMKGKLPRTDGTKS